MPTKTCRSSLLAALSLLLLTAVIYVQKQRIKALENERDNYRHSMQNYRHAYETEQRSRSYLMQDLEKLNDPAGHQLFPSRSEVQRVWVRHAGSVD